jgi:L-lactate permease
MKRFTLDQLMLATFLGGSAGGAFAVAENYRALGQYGSAARAVVAGVLYTGACCVLPWWVGSRGTILIAGIIGFAMMLLWLRFGDPRAQSRTVERRHSAVAVAGVVIVAQGFLLMTLLTFLATFLPIEALER